MVCFQGRNEEITKNPVSDIIRITPKKRNNNEPPGRAAGTVLGVDTVREVCSVVEDFGEDYGV